MTWKICEDARKNIEDETGETFLCYNEDKAEELCNYLNEKYGNWKPVIQKEETKVIPYDEEYDTHNDFIEWIQLMDWLDKTGKRLTEIDEIYQEEFKLELANAIEIGVDFKKIYGGNTEKTRKQYVDEQLSDLIEEKKMLKSYQADDLRRIEFLKKLIHYKTVFMTHEPPVVLETSEAKE